MLSDRKSARIGVPNDNVIIAIDRDGDGVADFELSGYPCDPSGSAAAQGTATADCVAMWLDEITTRGAKSGKFTQQPCP